MTTSGPINNLVLPTKGRYYFTRYDWKVDHQFNPSNKLFGRFSHVRHRSVGRFSNEPLWELVDPQFTIPIDQSNVVVSDTRLIRQRSTSFVLGSSSGTDAASGGARWQLGTAVGDSNVSRRRLKSGALAAITTSAPEGWMSS
jgi:hypothetical protein